MFQKTKQRPAAKRRRKDLLHQGGSEAFREAPSVQTGGATVGVQLVSK